MVVVVVVVCGPPLFTATRGSHSGTVGSRTLSVVSQGRVVVSMATWDGGGGVGPWLPWIVVVVWYSGGGGGYTVPSSNPGMGGQAPGGNEVRVVGVVVVSLGSLGSRGLMDRVVVVWGGSRVWGLSVVVVGKVVEVVKTGFGD